MTGKRLLFCKEYLLDLNAAQAAIRAGYSKKTARQIGAELLTKPDIQLEIARLMKIRGDRIDKAAAEPVGLYLPSQCPPQSSSIVLTD